VGVGGGHRGEAGVGKARLVQSIFDDARSRDVAVFWRSGPSFERTRPFGVVAAVLELSRRSPDPEVAGHCGDGVLVRARR